MWTKGGLTVVSLSTILDPFSPRLKLLPYFILEHIGECLQGPLTSFRVNPTSIKSLTGEATEMDKQTLTEQELLEGLTAHTAHADELAESDLVEIDSTEEEIEC